MCITNSRQFEPAVLFLSMAKKKLVVLTGAGISAESGLKTFRDGDGLWEGYDVTEVATPRAWKKNPQLVLDFYNMRRRNVCDAAPNAAHIGLAELENDFDVTIITQNIDDLHERAGSTDILHLHGEIFKMRFSHKPFHPHKTELLKVQSLEIKSDHRFHFQVDGEYLGKVHVVSAELIPEALEVLVPEERK